MTEPDFTQHSAAELAAGVRSGRWRAVDVVGRHLERIKATDGTVRAFITVTDEAALERAAAIDRAVAAGHDPGPLAGVPVAVKDNFCTQGVVTTAGSRMLAKFVPPYDATVVQRLNAAGAVIVGKTNMDEFAMGSATNTSAFFPTRNPWDERRVPGGSSGGSAAAVAAGQVPIALGSDTGGSVRQPASYCGVTGLKPTYGLVSRYGLIALAPTLDHVGVISRTAADAALVLSVIAGHDPLDGTSTARPALDDLDPANLPPGLTIGVPEEYFDDTDQEVAAAVRAAIDHFTAAGLTVRELSLPHTRHALTIYHAIAAAEAAASLSRYDGVRFGHRADDVSTPSEMIARSRSTGFGDEVKRRIMAGTFFRTNPAAGRRLDLAWRARRVLRGELLCAFDQVDLLLTPTTPTPAFAADEQPADPWSKERVDGFAATANLAGLPAISVTCGFAAGLPVGMQIMGAPHNDRAVLQAAAYWQRQTGHHLQRPVLEGAAPSGFPSDVSSGGDR